MLNGCGGKMSIHRNRTKFNQALTSMEYTRLMKNEHLYCYICVRRGGKYSSSCHPSVYNNKGWEWRENRTWKNNRNTQWKIK